MDICDVIDAIANSSNDIHNVRKILSDKEIEVFSKNVFPVEQPEYEYMEGKRDGFKEGLQYCRNVIFKWFITIMKKVHIIGMLTGITGMVLAWIFFSWKLVLILILVLWGNNIERK